MEIDSQSTSETAIQFEASFERTTRKTTFYNRKSLSSHQPSFFSRKHSKSDLNGPPTKSNGNYNFLNLNSLRKNGLPSCNFEVPIGYDISTENIRDKAYSPDSEFFDALQTPFHSDTNDEDQSPIEMTANPHSLWNTVSTEPCHLLSTERTRKSIVNVTKFRFCNAETDWEDEVLDILREIVRKCSISDHYRRPKAKEVANILSTVTNTTN